MSREREDQERPCLHCMMVELIDDFFAEYPATAGSDKIDIIISSYSRLISSLLNRSSPTCIQAARDRRVRNSSTA